MFKRMRNLPRNPPRLNRKDRYSVSKSDCRVVETLQDGSGGRTRTATGFTPTDFESVVSTNFTTPPLERGAIILSSPPKSTSSLRRPVQRARHQSRSNRDNWETWANDCWAACSTKLWKLRLLIASA